MQHAKISKGIILCKLHQLNPAENSTGSDARDESAASAVNWVPSGLFKNMRYYFGKIFLSLKDKYHLSEASVTYT